MVVHYGASTLGEYVNTLSTTEISSGWWEGEGIMGKSQGHSFLALEGIRKRTPFEQKNWTHVRKVSEYLRYDTVEEVVSSMTFIVTG